MAGEPSDSTPATATAVTAATAPTNFVATLFPGYFALVMATGIVATGLAQEGLRAVAESLYIAAAVGFVVLGVLLTIRIAIYPRLFAADVVSHSKGFAFLTIVAAINVMAAASIVIYSWWTLAWVLWFAGIVLWVPTAYATLFAVVLGRKPGLGPGINGTWFLLTVSIESIAVVGALQLAHDPRDMLAFACLALFVLGLVLYLIVMTMVFLRWTFEPLEPTEADPPAWIAAGAVAITVLAGSNLLLAKGGSPRIQRVAPFIEGMVVLAWATATFWFPLMVAIGVWRHLVRRVPLRYSPAYWAVVFPLGMYGVASYKMRLAIGLTSLGWLPKLTLGIAAAAWLATAVGLAGRLRVLRRRSDH
ncbi:MAG: tellurite resistance/C4-dicarboxylate transporter family protein [Ilumatobacteraceae bacterium]